MPARQFELNRQRGPELVAHPLNLDRERMCRVAGLERYARRHPLTDNSSEIGVRGDTVLSGRGDRRAGEARDHMAEGSKHAET